MKCRETNLFLYRYLISVVTLSACVYSATYSHADAIASMT